MNIRWILRFLCVALAVSPAWAQARIGGSITLDHPDRKVGNADVVVWLTPVDGHAEPPAASHPFRLAQRHKTFEPHLLVIPVGSVVQFPNYDPFFHNVFSLYEGRRFDLGLYESGASRSIRFTRVGVSYIFCNIHPQMSAVVITMQTPWYAVTGADGRFTLTSVPPGQYRLHVWYERSTVELLEKAAREITVDHDAELDPIKVQTSQISTSHKNKYGLDYDVSGDNNGPY